MTDRYVRQGGVEANQHTAPDVRYVTKTKHPPSLMFLGVVCHVRSLDSRSNGITGTVPQGLLHEIMTRFCEYCEKGFPPDEKVLQSRGLYQYDFKISPHSTYVATYHSGLFRRAIPKAVTDRAGPRSFFALTKLQDLQSARLSCSVMFFFQRSLIFSTLTLVVLALVNADPEPRRSSKVASDFKNHEEIQNKPNLGNREGKVFSLFNVVQFKNDGCRSSSTISGGGTGSTNRNGTCYRRDECTRKGGSVAGTCAAGFGVCCVFLVSNSGATINQNCSYIRNPNFPNAYDSTSQVSYNIQKCDNSVCSLRLDFESFSILGTGNTAEVDSSLLPLDPGGVCLDTFDVTTNTGSNIPTICGQNTGQHIYVDIGNLASDTAQLNFAFNGASNNRQWEIKVTQIPCNTQGHPNGCGCLQYHTGLTGRLTTFNFLPTNDNHLANQQNFQQVDHGVQYFFAQA
eukprot:maker-scaffold521_size146803-snap-gene-0.14 protein:Tk12190 transcript:maker-scaffold521_size146803-snap-gene-0.14-mRNA-1 annotation:"hypothetical protein KGM_18655"